MKQKDYRFSSLWLWGIADFLYFFFVLAWLTYCCSWWRSWCSYGSTAAGKRWQCCKDLIHFFAEETPESSVHRTPMHLYIQHILCLEYFLGKLSLYPFRALFWLTVREVCHTTQQCSTMFYRKKITEPITKCIKL